MDKLDEQLMLPSMKERWLNMTADTKAALRVAFNDFYRRPHLVAALRTSTLNLVGDRSGTLYNFRIGYAHFSFGIIPDIPSIVCDARLLDGSPMYVRGYVRQNFSVSYSYR